MTSISSTSQNLQQGFNKPWVHEGTQQVLPSQNKRLQGHAGLKERLKQEVTFAKKLTMSGSLLLMF